MKDKKDTKKHLNSCTCPCGGGQSCIVDRRSLGDTVVEDEILKKEGISVRKNCHERFTLEQITALKSHNSNDYESITF